MNERVFLSLSIKEAEKIQNLLENNLVYEYQEIDDQAPERMKAAVKLLCKVYEGIESAQRDKQ